MAKHWRTQYRTFRGFTLFEMLFAIAWLASVGVGIYITYLIIMALRRYIGS
jgi:type II secretory pathway component PulJ